MAASFVRRGAAVADIGTDHAYLPIYLVKSGVCVCVTAVDINPGPLIRAKENIARAGISDKITLRQSAGLSAVFRNEADDIVAAGMGGDLIVSILSACGWIKDRSLRLILSPNSKASVLRRWLYSEGFDILRERAVFDAGRVYTVMSAAYDGVIRRDETAVYAGGLCEAPGEAERAYIGREIDRLLRKAGGYECSGDAGNARLLRETAEKLRRAIDK